MGEDGSATRAAEWSANRRALRRWWSGRDMSSQFTIAWQEPLRSITLASNTSDREPLFESKQTTLSCGARFL